jgi:hypothetical protein
MKHSFINKKTKVEVNIFSEDLNSIKILHGQVHHASDELTILEGDELRNYFANQPTGCLVSISFNRGYNKCEFSGRFKSTRAQFVEIVPITPITEKSQRSYHRHQSTTGVKLFLLGDQNQAELACEGTAEDISLDAIAFTSNKDLLLSEEDRFYVEFTLFTRHNFKIPAKLLRKGRVPHTSKDRNRYVFLFDFPEDSQDSLRLATVFLKNKID